MSTTVMRSVRRVRAFPGKTRWQFGRLWWWVVTLVCGHTRLMPWQRYWTQEVEGKYQPRYAKCGVCSAAVSKQITKVDVRLRGEAS